MRPMPSKAVSKFRAIADGAIAPVNRRVRVQQTSSVFHAKTGRQYRIFLDRGQRRIEESFQDEYSDTRSSCATPLDREITPDPI